MVISISILVYLSIWLVLVPFMKKKVEKTLANTLAMQLDELDEKEKLNKLMIEADAEKRTTATQVDYVALLASSRTNEEWKYPETVKSETHQDSVVVDLKTKESSPSDTTDSQSHPQAPFTIHNDNGQFSKYLAKRLVNNNRIRLDSAPSTYKDPLDYGDVNLTLGGYLHTYHSQAVKHQLQKMHGSFNRGVPSNNQLTTSSQSNKAKGDGVALSSLFTQTVKKDAQKDDGQIPLISSADNTNASGKKTGRFTSVPAKIETKNIPAKDLSCKLIKFFYFYLFFNYFLSKQ